MPTIVNTPLDMQPRHFSMRCLHDAPDFPDKSTLAALIRPYPGFNAALARWVL
jgi:hypothetical protein